MANRKVKVAASYRDRTSGVMDIYLVKGSERVWLMAHRRNTALFNLLRNPVCLDELYTHNSRRRRDIGRAKAESINHSVEHICRVADQVMKYEECFC